MQFIIDMLAASWHLLEESSVYILGGLVIAGMLKIFLSPTFVAEHLGQGKIRSVFKAALLGVPIPLCSCGVLPAAAQLKRQGANNGATTAFLIATPESGVDSITVSWALLDPLMTVARPVAAFISAVVAGILENMVGERQPSQIIPLPMAMPLPSTCSDSHCGCHEEEHHPIGLLAKLRQGLGYALNDIWGDLAGWFFIGILVAAAITVLIPSELISRHLGGGLGSMLLALLIGLPMYICATASTPIAAAMILKGVSPGTALVFLLTGPATNIAALAVLLRILGKKGVAIYLLSISVISVLCGLILDAIYLRLGLSAAATIGQVSEALPQWLMISGAVALLGLSVAHLLRHLPGVLVRWHLYR
jgi:uncharacterized membrane protein YraQ (UPF0718 family)